MTGRLLTIDEAAEVLRLSRDAVERLCRCGRLAHYRVGLRGGRIVITEAALEAYLAASLVSPVRAARRVAR